MSHNIRFRKALPTDIELLEHWDRQQHVIDCAPNEEYNWEYELSIDPEWREMLIAELDGRPLGFMHIIDPAVEETHYWGEDCPENLRALDIWIGEADDLGKGYGTTMMRLALQRCFNVPEVTAVIIDPLVSNTDAIRFYERVGFRFVEHRTFFEVDHCAVYEMKREDWDQKPF